MASGERRRANGTLPCQVVHSPLAARHSHSSPLVSSRASGGIVEGAGRVSGPTPHVVRAGNSRHGTSCPLLRRSGRFCPVVAERRGDHGQDWHRRGGLRNETRRSTVKFAHSDSTTELKVTTDTSVRLEGAASELSALKPGMAVTVQVGSEGEAERILAHTAKDKPASSSTAKVSQDQSHRRRTNRPSRNPRRPPAKTHSKRIENPRLRRSIPRPVMTTPLGTLEESGI